MCRPRHSVPCGQGDGAAVPVTAAPPAPVAPPVPRRVQPDLAICLCMYVCVRVHRRVGWLVAVQSRGAAAVCKAGRSSGGPAAVTTWVQSRPTRAVPMTPLTSPRGPAPETIISGAGSGARGRGRLGSVYVRLALRCRVGFSGLT